jgi:hypothetical protein
MSDAGNSERDVFPLGNILGEDDAPLDEDLDEGDVDSAEADERAAREGTKSDSDSLD